ncbi:hypothetical protein COU57_02695 [Candidatus Pacearchaeota archaeon CG10_big_fil_rev_8_21_14_0_10_32_14]|nr:MAG: hypothetical protein COU57_02695 [Candidatus Pacearchaeota archaeon CG10_big_fil_rev_8_21_14_0_10_32_14]
MEDFEVESAKFKGVLISDLLNPEIVNAINKLGDIEIIALTMMKKNDNNSSITPILLNHQGSQEVKDKVVHIVCPDPQILKKIAELISKNKNGK